LRSDLPGWPPSITRQNLGVHTRTSFLEMESRLQLDRATVAPS
jgi:hypothetical protein